MKKRSFLTSLTFWAGFLILALISCSPTEQRSVSKTHTVEIKAMQFNIRGMEREKTAMLQETQGMLYGMQYEIQSMQKKIQSMEEKVIPALQKTLDTYFINYQENKMQLTLVIDAWEALLMMQMNVLDEKLKLYEMIVDYEKELYR